MGKASDYSIVFAIYWRTIKGFSIKEQIILGQQMGNGLLCCLFGREGFTRNRNFINVFAGCSSLGKLFELSIDRFNVTCKGRSGIQQPTADLASLSALAGSSSMFSWQALTRSS